MFRLNPPVSAYLAQPAPQVSRRPDWSRWRLLVVQTWRSNPHLLRRSLAALPVWTLIVGTYQTAINFSVPGSGTAWQLGGIGLANTAPGTNTTANAISPANLVPAAHAEILPSGPSGQLMPPGTMAPDRTYANSYARGQCTWYVAGRRQLPSNWGNARTWYYHATSLGWSVGTLPAVAAIAWTPSGYYGHVALVEQVSADGKSVYVSEMNYRGLYVKSYRWADATAFKYIY